MIQICLGFEDHMTVYLIDTTVAEDLQAMYDVDDMAAHIVECGIPQARVAAKDIETFLDETHLFFDATIPTVDNMTEFLDNVATALVNE